MDLYAPPKAEVAVTGSRAASPVAKVLLAPVFVIGAVITGWLAFYATVYLPIPEKGQGTGQVQVSVSGRKKIVRAVSAGPRFEAFTEVRVVEARDDATLVAGPIT